jgi:8-oxo-dGTP pyrophosphatase MutT (NUDIX family)
MPPVRHQAAAIPLRNAMVCLVTSRNRKRWVIPKGMIAAELEAWEEAGVVGVMDPEPVGHYDYTKNGMLLRVVVYVLHVTTERQLWPEQHQRQRVWLPIDTAADLLEEPMLQEIIRRVAKQSGTKPAEVPSELPESR